jgi:transcriptional regulator with XRE-family HTH domain
MGVDRMDFRLLRMRMVSHVRARVRNGEISERGLARLTGISQPHIHNVLKGVRALSMEKTDQILERLRIDLADLLTAAEAGAGSVEPSTQASAGCGACRLVAMLDGRIGREHPYPQAIGRERYPFPAAEVDRLEFPVAARLAPDPLRAPLLSGPGVVLLDRSEQVRRDPDEEGYFALDLSGGGTIGLVRCVRRGLYLWVRLAEEWKAIPLPERGSLDVIRGRVVLVVRPL